MCLRLAFRQTNINLKTILGLHLIDMFAFFFFLTCKQCGRFTEGTLQVDMHSISLGLVKLHFEKNTQLGERTTNSILPCTVHDWMMEINRTLPVTKF